MEITLGFLLVALGAYALFGGADFGGGILEATLRRQPRLQRKIQNTLAPVWEANHVWLIAAVVILFIGFPVAYAQLSTVLFVPISLALLGIILRGAFFTFRKYDPEPERREELYTILFRASSALTPFMYGMLVASLLGRFPSAVPGRDMSFLELYVRPWATWHGVFAAIFVYALFGYVASVFMYGELDSDADRTLIGRRVIQFFVATFAAGGLVLAYGAVAGIVPWREELNPVQIAAQIVALVAIPWLWMSLRRRKIWRMRLIAGAQVVCILAGWFRTHFPNILRFDDGSTLTVFNSVAPEATLSWLNIGLALVVAVVVPLLIYLYRVFGTSSSG